MLTLSVELAFFGVTMADVVKVGDWVGVGAGVGVGVGLGEGSTGACEILALIVGDEKVKLCAAK